MKNFKNAWIRIRIRIRFVLRGCPEKLDPDPNLVFWPLNHYHSSKAFYQNFVPLYSLNTKTRLYVFKFSGEAQPLPSPFVDLSNDNRSLPKLFLLPPFLTSSFSVTPAAKAASVVLVDLNLFENIS